MPDLIEFDYSAFMTYKPIIFSAADDCAFEHINWLTADGVFILKQMTKYIFRFLSDWYLHYDFYQQVRSDFTLVAQLVAKVVF